jgi:tRNA(fMet)-specific endonuclease VapC
MKYILDTDHVSLILRGDQRVLDRVAQSGGETLTTVVTVQEVFNGWVVKIHGVGPGADFVGLYGELWKSLDYLRSSRVLQFDQSADDCFRGLLQQYPELRKHRIQRDVRIAAIALAIDATVVTRNRRDFELVPGLRIVDWSEP